MNWCVQLPVNALPENNASGFSFLTIIQRDCGEKTQVERTVDVVSGGGGGC